MGHGNFLSVVWVTRSRWPPCPYMLKTLKFFFSGTNEPMAMGLGMQHWGHGPIVVCSFDDSGLTLTYFIARSNLAPYAFVWKKNGFFRN